MTKPANTLKSGKRGGKTRTSWKPGQSGNPAGAPKRGESWAEIIKLYADMTPEEIADKAKDVAGQLRKIGGGISMKEAVVIRIYAALMFEPTSGLWKELMERAEGKVTDRVDVTTGGDKLIDKDADDTRAEILRKLAGIAAATGADKISERPDTGTE